jgi:Mg-chelatase subunit ChlD
LVDNSGSMTSYSTPLSSAAWILAHAAHTHHATTATITFGPSVTLLTPPRHKPQHVHEIQPAGGTDTFPDAIKLADQLLQLRRPGTTRLLTVVSDAHLANPDAAQQLLTTLHHTGCRILWLAPTGISATPFTHTTTIQIADPVEATTHISRAALDALATPGGGGS